MRRVKFKVVDVFDRGKRCSIYARGKYSLDYVKGTIVRAIKGTLGVAVFKTRKQAENFSDCNYHKIIRVVPVGRGRTVKIVSRGLDPLSFNYFYIYRRKRGGYPFDVKIISPPPGTVFYPAVEVIE